MKILLRQTLARQDHDATRKSGNGQSQRSTQCWQLRWSEKNLHGMRVQRKRVIGSVERYPDEAAARSAVTVLLAEINSDKVRMSSRSITMAQLCDHFEQRELTNPLDSSTLATLRTG
jgi:hypothetical protein